MRTLMYLLVPLAVLLLRLADREPVPTGRHAATGKTPAPSTDAAQPSPPRQPGPRRERPVRRIPDRDAFYRLAEYSRHASRWNFRYDHDALAAYTATHRVNPDVTVAASSVAALADLLGDIDVPSHVRRYQLDPRDRRMAEQERAELDLLVSASPGAGAGAGR
ncbi:hypothetical protein HNR23_004129 [Nocardiopsis mwathae]|uniref:Uncharacterized protein n=1 Tax=Nocardiopsis mwathae TaxID=1472723 RepID=A0A7W9YKY2_9ACTN|nr:hypothetical protein [Nocardiopsis mwathae]MBB6174069.1 hypothetical protein [Nocardiopsis mwathae]